MQKVKVLSEEALQIAEKTREAKVKGEKERYTHLNAEFQRIERTGKKAFLVINAKKQENNKMRKARDLFKKIRKNNQKNLKNKNNNNKKKSEKNVSRPKCGMVLNQ